jgi:hypothetical protein
MSSNTKVFLYGEWARWNEGEREREREKEKNKLCEV